MKIINPIFFTMILMLMLIGHTLQETNKVENIYNLTEEIMVWDFNYTETVITNTSDMTSINAGQAGRVSNIILKFVDFAGYSAMEISKYFIEFGYNNPQYDYDFGLMIIKFYFILIISATLAPLVVPLMLLIYLIFLGFKKIFIRNGLCYF